MSAKKGIASKQKRITILVNDKEFEAFKNHKEMEGKSGQLLAYMALKRSGLLTDKGYKKK
ncbi:MAG: hypothetical protein IE909_15175 [Campylobacterales bacterium]|nr:hypothetical protein [Campylobacterota bacterium]MBD3843189.1 hypothetical protein [Campylobacterales bacterium]